MHMDRDQIKALLTKYDRPGPRYTSYPPAPHYTTEVGTPQYVETLGNVTPEDGLTLYAHIPFCEQRCTYCGCYVIPTRQRAVSEQYVDSLRREVLLVRNAVGFRGRVDALHFGGGTPTYLEPAQLKALLATIREAFRVEDAREISAELDPRVTTDEHLRVLRSEGTNRVSLGVQDTSDVVQQAIGRNQKWEDTLRCFEACRDHGFEGVNIDLVYGLPFQTPERFEKTLEDILRLHPNRLAIFGYAHVPWARANQKGIDEEALPGPRERLHLLVLAHQTLAEGGYRHIGMDHYALPDDELSKAQEAGKLGRSFMGYTAYTDSKMLGFGVSSIGDLQDGYFQNEKKLSRYTSRIDDNELPIERGWLSSADDKIRRHVIQEVLCNLKLDYADFERRFGTPFLDYFAPEQAALEELERDGLLIRSQGELQVTSTGRLVARNIAMTFDRYLRESKRSGPTYSRTV